MKKLLTLLLLIAFSFGAKSQIVTYKVDTTAYSNGLLIPAPFYFTVKKVEASIINQGLSINSLTVNHTDTVNVINIKNDSINSLKMYPVTKEYIDTMNLDGLIQYIIRDDLERIYGANNVTKLD
jgi:hypothetical protein